MSFNAKRNRRRATFIGAGIGFILIFTFVLTLIIPNAGRNSSSSSDTLYYTPAPTPIVFPTPQADPQLRGELPYIHSTGYFQTFRPAGTDWTVDEGDTTTTGGFARVIMQSGQRLAVIHNYIQPGVQYESLDQFSTEFLNAEHFASAWGDYGSWEETGRTITEDSVIVNFNLVADDLPYLGRVTARLDGDWLFMSRIVVPANNPVLLDLLQSLVAAQFYGYDDLLVLPQDWPAYSDQESGFVFKHPAEWELVAGGLGRPVTFSIPGLDGKNLVRLWTVPNVSIDSEAAASTWVTDAEPDAQIVGALPLTHEWDGGYRVAYTFTDTAGNTHSALTVLLNDDAGTLFIANLQAEPPDVDLLGGQDLSDAYATALQSMTSGFIVLPDETRQLPSVQ